MNHRSLAHAMIVAMLLLDGPSAVAEVRKKPAPPSTAATQPTTPQSIARTTFIAQMDSQFGKMDADKNGQLTRVEIEQFQKTAALAEAETRNRALFVELDSDGNKQLSEAEFAKLMTAPTAANATPMISREDGNRDGQISLIEHRTATLANFDRVDTDKDGIVSAAEMKAGGVVPR